VVVALAWQLVEVGGNDVRHSPAPATKLFVDKRLGMRFGYPPSWRLERRGPARRLFSPDRSISIVLGSPTPGAFVPLVRRDSERTLRRTYRPARIVGRQPGRLGTQRVLTTEMTGTTRSGGRIRILSIAAASRWRTYAVAVFSSTRPPAPRLLEAQAILRSVVFVRPSKRR
jgi:hypothetical protein